MLNDIVNFFIRVKPGHLNILLSLRTNCKGRLVPWLRSPVAIDRQHMLIVSRIRYLPFTELHDFYFLRIVKTPEEAYASGTFWSVRLLGRESAKTQCLQAMLQNQAY